MAPRYVFLNIQIDFSLFTVEMNWLKRNFLGFMILCLEVMLYFFYWIPNCNEGNLQFKIPTKFVVKLLPPELKHMNILKRIGKSLGKLIVLDLAYERSNDAKLLIKCQINKTNIKP